MQTLYIGTDHGGFSAKEALKPMLAELGVQVEDFGAHTLDADDDYPQFAFAVAEAVARDAAAGRESIGVLLCRSGAGMEIAANKVDGVRAGRADSVADVKLLREHNGANVLTLAADTHSLEQLFALITAFVQTPLSDEERHARRIAAITEYERTHA